MMRKTSPALICAALALASLPAFAQDTLVGPKSRLEAQRTTDSLAPLSDEATLERPYGTVFEQGVSLGVERAANLANPELSARNETLAYAELHLGLRQALGDRLSLRAQSSLLAVSASFAGENDSDVSFSLAQLYVQHDDPIDGRQWRLGRQPIEDSMGWIMDADVDGLRFAQSYGRVRVDASFTRESWLEVGTEDREDIAYNALLMAAIEANPESQWVPYLLHRSEREFNEGRAAETTWLGLQGLIRLNPSVRYWVNAVARTGEAAGVDGDRALGGLAADLGLTWTLRQRFRPALTFGFASSSGDSDDDDGTNDTFRQSGLHTNTFALNDHNSFSYLGEVLNPELSNLEVLTLGLGLQFNPRWSADVAWHSYRQVEEEDVLRGTQLDDAPAGEEDDLGRALDLVIGYEHSETVAFQAVAGRFESGKAFTGFPDPAWLLRLEMDWAF